MANPHKGEYQLEVGNVIYNVFYDWDALCTIEAELKKPIGKLATEWADVSSWSAAQARVCLYHGLKHNYPNISLKQVGDMIAQAGGLKEIFPALRSAIAVAFPETLDTDEQQNPPQPNQANSIGSAN